MAANALSIKFYELEDSTNMLFVSTHQISIPNAYKTIKIEIGMEHFLDESNELQTIARNASKHCQNIWCRNIHHIIQQFQNNLQKLMHSRRSKRATSVILSLYDMLFGGRDALKELDQALDQLQGVHTTNSNNSAGHIQINVDALQIHKEVLNDLMKKLSDHLLKVEGDQSTMDDINLILHLARQGNEVLKIILDILDGKTAQIIDIIGYNDFDAHFKEIKRTLRDNEHLLAENVMEIIASADIATQLIDNTMSIDIKIPIGSVDDYHSYRIIPLPFVQDSYMERIKSSGYQIVHSKRTNETFTISESSLNQCRKLKEHENRIICTADKFAKEHEACEMAIFANRKPNSCEYERIQAQSRVIRVSINTFYIVTRNASNLKVTCNDNTKTYRIEQSSWFQLESGCLLQFGDEKFRVPHVESYKNVEIVIPKIEIADFGKHNANADLLPDIIDTNVINTKFRNITGRLRYLLQQTSENGSTQLAEKRNDRPYLWLFVIVFWCILLMICSLAIDCIYNRLLFVRSIFTCSRESK